MKVKIWELSNIFIFSSIDWEEVNEEVKTLEAKRQQTIEVLL